MTTYLYIILIGAAIWGLARLFRKARRVYILVWPRHSWLAKHLARLVAPLGTSIDALDTDLCEEVLEDCRRLEQDQNIKLVAIDAEIYRSMHDTTPALYQQLERL